MINHDFLSSIPKPGDLSSLDFNELPSDPNPFQRFSYSQNSIHEPNQNPIVSIGPSTCADILNGKFTPQCKEFVIFDCRFYYEYLGGHIKGAFNITKRNQLLSFFNEYSGKSVCFIFHCEFSVDRGPTWASVFRSIDREINSSVYPHLTFPHVFILVGGYKSFYHHYPHLTTGGYCPMENDGTNDRSLLKKCNELYLSQTSNKYTNATPPPTQHDREKFKIYRMSSSQPNLSLN